MGIDKPPQELLRVLTVTSLFPSSARPRHGIFVETRLKHLVRDCAVEARVIAPVPWFPSRAAVFGAYATMAATPRAAVRESGLAVRYPRYPMLPRVGVGLQPDSMAWAAAGEVTRLLQAGWRPDIVDAHYFYPDGVAAALLAQRFDLPLVITARGTDVNVIARQPGPGRRIAWAARRAAAVIAVSARLKDALVELGVEPSKVVVLRNGVDAELFRPEPAAAARAHFGLPDGVLLGCVGNLAPEKGQALAIEALRHLGACRLVIVGEGALRAELEASARQHGVAERVHWLGNMPQAQLRQLYAALDVLLLPSLREGWPNVLLEAMACGTPVVASDVGAVADVITDRAVGRIVAGREALRFAQAVGGLLDTRPDRAAVRRHAEQFDWASISRAQLELFRAAVDGHRAGAATPSSRR
jgi:teichuronic acid biosynthesis glycosyltransferase TuaC